MDRNYFLYIHNRKCKAKAVGIIVIVGSYGIEDTVHTLKRYINESFSVPQDSILEIHGYAYELGEAQNDSQIQERAREFGREMVNKQKENDC